MSYRTSASAVDKTEDTPVWWCADCGRKIRRTIAPEV
jgi:rubrerythrin